MRNSWSDATRRDELVGLLCWLIFLPLLAVNLADSLFPFLDSYGFVNINDPYVPGRKIYLWSIYGFYPLIAIVSLFVAGKNYCLSYLSICSLAGALLLPIIAISLKKNVSTAILVAMFFTPVFLSIFNSLASDCLPDDIGGRVNFFELLVFVVICWLIFPVFIMAIIVGFKYAHLAYGLHFLVNPQDNTGLFRGQSFRGMASDRISYSYFCGLAMLSIAVLNFKKRYKCAVVGFLFLGLLLSESRAGMLAFVVSVIWLGGWRIFKFRGAWLYLSLIFLVIIFMKLFSFRPDLLGDPGGRLMHIKAYVECVLGNPLILLVGNGTFYSDINLWPQAILVRPHSWVLNTILNFGLIVLGAWTCFLVFMFNHLEKLGRAVLIYAVVFGLFHNAFDAYLFLPEQLLWVVFAVAVSRERFKSRRKIELDVSESRHGSNFAV